MIPSVVATQLQDSLVDYILATLAFDDPTFAAAFEAQLRGPDGLFRGPYLRLGLPFATAKETDPNPLTITPGFLPYAHQLQAFQQLGSAGDGPPRNTLVTTGTGSGKTECFLYPILDHCWRHRDTPGVKAILIYPMNALATDQARRLAEIIHADDRLRGTVRAGLYVGGGDKSLPSHMGPTHLVENKQALRNEPPAILLTNYKMLDFMLLRPDERRLWQHNTPQTLRYLVIDELHTFDGAQGSDVGCLVRRLKARLQTPAGHLVCAGTSATIGSATDAETFSRLADFARDVFDEPFASEHVVREQRVPRVDFLRLWSDAALPPPDAAVLDPDGFDEPSDWLGGQQRLWFGAEHTPVDLGEAMRAHPFLNHLLAAAADRPTSLDDVDAALAGRVPDWTAVAPRSRRALLASFLGLISHARRLVGGKERPLLTVQVQLWSRELTRLLRALPDQADDALLPHRFAWWTDVPGQVQPEGHYAPQAHCRECGIDGIAAVRTEVDVQKGRITITPGEVGKAWLRRSRDACFVWPRPLARAERPTELIHWLHPDGATLHSAMPTEADGTPRGAPVLLETTLKESGGDRRYAARCPACGADDALSIVGARAASLSSVAVTQLFQSPLNDDKKLLAFTDSVQDACHRAGFFGGRTFRIHLRTAIQTVIAANDPLPLHDAAAAFEAHWRPELGDMGYLAAFLPHDLRELPEVLRYIETSGKGKHERIWRILRERLGWEITREFGVAAAIGRSLENSAASTVRVDPARLARATTAFAGWLAEQTEPQPGADAAHFLRGLLHRMRHMGAVHHPYLARYVTSDGNRYLHMAFRSSQTGMRSRSRSTVRTRTVTGDLVERIGRRTGRIWLRVEGESGEPSPLADTAAGRTGVRKRVWESLLGLGHGTARDVAATLGTRPREARNVLALLVNAGPVTRRTGDGTPANPRDYHPVTRPL